MVCSISGLIVQVEDDDMTRRDKKALEGRGLKPEGSSGESTSPLTGRQIPLTDYNGSLFPDMAD